MNRIECETVAQCERAAEVLEPTVAWIVIGAVNLVFAYFITDRILSQYYTDSWWKQPEDVEVDHDK